MTKRLSRFYVEIPGRRQPRVTPVAIGPDSPVVIPASWEQPVRLESAWQTDVAQSEETVREDRRSLQPRPVRHMEAFFRGIRQGNAMTVFTGLGRRGSSVTPVPMWCDKAPLTSAVTAGATEVPCDTRWRRFFPGQRIVVVQRNYRVLSDSPREHATIKRVLYDRLELTATLANSYAKAPSLVVPCFDAEAVLEASGGCVSDEDFAASLAFLEKNGGNTLPSLWGENAAALAPHYQGLPILLARANWVSPPTAGQQRVASRTPVGKASHTVLHGARFRWRFAGQYDHLTREAAWPTLRFFDSRRGRANAFWFANPLTAWRLQQLNLGNAVVAAAGDLGDNIQFFGHVVIELRDGNAIGRGIASIVDLGAGQWQINFSEPLASVPTNVRRVTSMHRVRFSDDAVLETWVTDEHCSFALAVEELLLEQDRGVDDLAYAVASHGAPDDIPDLFCWFDVARNGLTFDNMSGTYYRASAWPALRCLLDEWVDVRQRLPDLVRPDELPPLRISRATPGAGEPYLTPFARPERNGGHHAVIFRDFARFHFATDASLALWDRELWSNVHGWTLVVVCIGGTSGAGSARELMHLEEGTGGQLVFQWVAAQHGGNPSFGNVQAFAIPGTVDPNLAIQHGTFDNGRPSIWVLRWTPGQQVQLYEGGTLLGTTVSALNSMPSVVSYNPSNQFTYFNHGAGFPPATSRADEFYRTKSLLNSFLSYKRALYDSELNAIGAYFAQSYAAPWSPLP